MTKNNHHWKVLVNILFPTRLNSSQNRHNQHKVLEDLKCLNENISKNGYVVTVIYGYSDLRSRIIWPNATVKANIPNIHALNSVFHTLRIQYKYTQKQCVGVAIEGMDIWYMGLKKC